MNIGNLIYVVSGENLTIKDNTFKNISSGNSIVYINNSSSVDITNNLFNNIAKDDNYINFIYLIENTRNSSINFNNFTNNIPTDYSGVSSINIGQANNTEIFNNTWQNSTLYYSIQITGKANDIDVYNNNISCKGGVGSHGIILRGAYNSTVYDNLIYNCHFGVLFHNSSRDNIAYRNYIEETNTSLYIIDDAVNNSAYNFTIKNATIAIYFYRYNDRGNNPPINNTAYNFIINGTREYDIASSNVSLLREGNNTVRDITFYESEGNFALISLNSTSITMINVTSEAETEDLDGSSSFIRKWYLNASSNINNTNITITNSTGNTIYSDIINGSIPRQTLIDYVNEGGTQTNYSNYTITTSASGFITNITKINLTDNTNLNFYNSSSPNATFSCAPSSVTQGQITTCTCQGNYQHSLIINLTVEGYLGENNIYSFNPSTDSVGTYTLNCTVVDNANRMYSLTTSYNVTSSGSSSGGGGSTTSSWKTTAFPTEEEFENGYSKELKVNNRMRVKVGEEYHYVGVKELTATSAVIEISSDPVSVNLDIGEDARIDVDSDGFYDVYVILNSINGVQADVTIQKISEEVIEGEETVSTSGEVVTDEEVIEEIEESGNWTWLIIIVLVLLVAVGVMVKKGKRKGRKKKR